MRKAIRRRDVRWSVAAEGDLHDIVDFIAADDRSVTAWSVLDKLRTQAESLEMHAERGRRVPELGRRAAHPVWRELIVRPWRLIYTTDDDTVLIVAVVDSRRDFLAWLAKRVAV